MANMKNIFAIEQRSNLSDNWIIRKRFKTLKKAEQSYYTRVKHRFSITKDTPFYDNYRIRNLETNEVLKLLFTKKDILKFK